MDTCICSKSHAKTISVQDLRSLQWAATQSPAGLCDREMRLFQLLAAAQKRKPGATRLNATVGDLVRAHREIKLGTTSPSTIRRALAGLEAKGYLIRRHGFGSLDVRFNVSRWVYWTQRRAGNICPMPNEPTSVYIPLRQSIRAGHDRTNTRSIVNTQNISNKTCNHARARERFNFLSTHPVLLTLWCILRGSPDISLYNRAEREVLALDHGAGSVDTTGIPWEDYARNWADMLPATRDAFARSQILPRLRDSSRETCPPADVAEGVAISTPATPADLSPDEIRTAILASLNPPSESPPDPYPEIDLTDPEMRALVLERDRLRRRAVDG